MSKQTNATDLIEIIAVTDHVPQTRSTINRWATAGLIGRNGDRIKLRSRMIGGRRFTTLAWVDEFLDAINAEPEPIDAAAELDELMR